MIGFILLLQLCACGRTDAPTATCTDTTATAVSQPHIENGISLTVQRLAMGCGTVRVSSGVPVPPGKVTPAQLSQLAIFVGGQEQRLYVEALKGTHPDGSLRSVLIQFDYPVTSGTPVPGELVLNRARRTSDIQKSVDDDGAAAIVLPTDADYLVSAQLVGPTLTVAATARLSPVFQKYEDDFRAHADNHWRNEAANWEGNYYDRALIYYAWWIRSGNAEYWKRATAIALNYRKQYLEKANYHASAHWQQIEGIELHYLLTGEEASRYAVGRVADVFNGKFYMHNLSDLTAEMDNRVQARTLMALLTAWKLRAESQAGANWATLLPKALSDILSTQDASGAYRWVRAQCRNNLPFQVGVLNDALIKYHTYFNADARILPAIQKSVDYMWAKDWIDAEQAFIYLDGPCEGSGNDPAPDLNNLIVSSFGWVYRQTGNAVYRDRGDQIFAGGVAKAWLDGSKHFNQNYTSSYRYLAYRQ